MPRQVIITAALAGSMTMKEHNPAVPYTPEEFVREAKQAEDAGAAIVHIHARHPDHGAPSAAPDHFRAILTEIKARTAEAEPYQTLTVDQAEPVGDKPGGVGKQHQPFSKDRGKGSNTLMRD